MGRREPARRWGIFFRPTYYSIGTRVFVGTGCPQKKSRKNGKFTDWSYKDAAVFPFLVVRPSVGVGSLGAVA